MALVPVVGAFPVPAVVVGVTVPAAPPPAATVAVPVVAPAGAAVVPVALPLAAVVAVPVVAPPAPVVGVPVPKPVAPPPAVVPVTPGAAVPDPWLLFDAPPAQAANNRAPIMMAVNTKLNLFISVLLSPFERNVKLHKCCFSGKM